MSIKLQQLLPTEDRLQCQVLGQGLAALWNLETLYLYSSKTGELVKPQCEERNFYYIGTTANGDLVIPSIRGNVSVCGPDGRLKDQVRLGVRGHLLGAHRFSDGRFLALSGDRYGGMDEPDSYSLLGADGEFQKLVIQNWPSREKMIVLPWDDVLIPKRGYLVRGMDQLVWLGSHVAWTKARGAGEITYVSATGPSEITGHDADGLAVASDTIGKSEIDMISITPGGKVLIAANDGRLQLRSMEDLALVSDASIDASCLIQAHVYEDLKDWVPPLSALPLGREQLLIARRGSPNALVLNSDFEIIEEIRIAEPDGLSSIHALDEDHLIVIGLGGGVGLVSATL